MLDLTEQKQTLSYKQNNSSSLHSETNGEVTTLNDERSDTSVSSNSNEKDSLQEDAYGDLDDAFADEDALYPYCVFPQKIVVLIVIICATEGLLSTIAASSFFGCLDQIRKHFHVTNETVNLAIVVYFICQGLAPTCVTFMIDSGYIGKRNMVLIGCVIYATTCVGIANAKNFGTILGLRCVQSFSISPVIAINSSIASDITKKEKRGNIVGLVGGFQVCAGSAFGSVISAGLTNQFGWTGIFYYLAIMGYAAFVICFFCLPETKRTECGNGSLLPYKWFDRAPITQTSYWKKNFLSKPYEQSRQETKKTNFFGFIEIIKKTEMIHLLMASGMQFCLWTCHLTSLSTVFSNSHYNMSTLEIGKCYLPSGVCTLFSIVGGGRVLNWNYKRRKTQYDAWIQTQLNNEDFDISLPKYKFNIYKARLEFANIPLLISGVSFVICGWLMQTQQSVAAILVFSGIGCLFSNCILTFSTTLTVDLHPFAGSTAAASVNLSRCFTSALFVGVLDYMFDAMGVGGTFVLLFGITAGFSVGLIYTIKYGTEWEYNRVNGIKSTHGFWQRCKKYILLS
ncbi:hypothetical protein ACO0QE_001165 [Hanseniaspora vineae]